MYAATIYIAVKIDHLAHNKAAEADGLPVELFKHDDEEPTRSISLSISRLLYSAQSTKRETVCTNYHGIWLAKIAYTVLSSVLYERQTDWTLSVRQILKGTREKRINTHQLSVAFKAKQNCFCPLCLNLVSTQNIYDSFNWR